jgi:predicted PurR-regulated permease PerM
MPDEHPPPRTVSTTAPPPLVMPGVQRFVFTCAALALGIAALHYGRDVLMPLAFAALLAFVLDPVVTWLRRWHLPHAAAVASVLTLAIALLGGLGLLIGQQASALSTELPAVRENIQKKLQSLQPSGSKRWFTEASRVIGAVEGGLNAARQSIEPAAAKPRVAPTHVIVEAAPASPLRAIRNGIWPILVPVATAGLVIVLVAYMLMQRRELRDRIVRLTGGDLHTMADAMNESALRVSRYLAAQVMINVGYGLPLALGLWWIGVPGAWLWGFVAAVSRFVPYLGPAIAALIPLLIAFAVEPGWSMVGWTLALILTLEFISNQIVEPLALGGSTGISPLAVLLSAAFWALVWGPVGLVLAMPLTVCAVVIGRHIAPLKFLGLLLGSAPAFDTPTRLYQRLISGDQAEALELCREEVARTSLREFYSATAVPMLALSSQAAASDATAAHRHRVVSGTSRVLEDLRGDDDGAAESARVICVGARSELDTLSAEMLAHALRASGHPARAVAAVQVTPERIGELDLHHVLEVYVCTFDPTLQIDTRTLCTQLRGRAQAPRIILAAWLAGDALQEPDAVEALGADALAVTLTEAVERADAPDPTEQARRRAAAAVADAPTPDDQSPQTAALRDALSRAAQRAVEVFDVPLATVALSTGEQRRVQASAGLPIWTQRCSDIALPEGSPGAHVLAHGELLVVPDLAREPRFADRLGPALEGLCFFAAAPVRDDADRVAGLIALHDVQTRAFSDEDQSLLASMADDLLREMDAAGVPSEGASGERAAAAADGGTPALASVVPQG